MSTGKFILDFLAEAALIFVSFTGAYLVASYVLFSSAHGNTTAWEELRKKLEAPIRKSHIRICDARQVVLISGLIEKPSVLRLNRFVRWVRQIQAVERRIKVLHKRARFVSVAVIVAFAGGLILSGPMLFGEPPLSDKLRYVSTVVPTAFMIGFYFVVNQRHAAIWSELQDEVATLVRDYPVDQR